MSEAEEPRVKGNTVFEAASLKTALGGWDGAPPTPPDIMVRAWWIDPYWYVSSTDGEHQVMSQQDVLTQEDLQWCAGEHIRILFLKKEELK